MNLSKRLELVASFVKEGSCLADIGTDHGYIPIALVERGIVPYAIAMDVRTGPQKRAAEHIRNHKLETRIETRLSDGAALLKPGEADTVVIAGMGGELMIHILEEGSHLWDSVRQWVLSPQSDLSKVRFFLQLQGFVIVREAMVKEDGKYYTVMEAARGEMAELSRSESLYGRCLIQDKSPVLKEFLRKKEQKLRDVKTQLEGLEGRVTETAAKRMRELTRELDWIKAALDDMQ